MIGRRAKLGATLVKFGEPHSRHQMQLVDRQSLFERCSLTIIVASGAVGRGEVHPQGRLRRIFGSCGRQMLNRLVEIARLERVEAKLIEVVRIGAGQGLSAQ